MRDQYFTEFSQCRICLESGQSCTNALKKQVVSVTALHSGAQCPFFYLEEKFSLLMNVTELS